MPVPEFAQAGLFGPLGIARFNWTSNCELTKRKKDYSQIHLRPGDMLKLGILFADGGRGHGQQILSESWMRTSIVEHSHVDNVSYGYFWGRPWLNVETSAGSQRIDVVAAPGQWWPKDLPRPAIRPGRRFHRRRLQREAHPARYDHGEDHSSRIDRSCQSRQGLFAARISCADKGQLPEFRSDHLPGNPLLTTFIYPAVPCE